MDKTVVAVLAIAVGTLAAPLLAAQLSKHFATGTQEPNQPAAITSGEEDLVEVVAAEPPPPPPVMTRDQFFQIRGGMTLAQCLAIIGVEGEPADASNSGAAGTSAAFRWQEPSGPNEFVLGFRDGRVSSKNMGMSGSARKKASSKMRAQKALEKPISSFEVQRLEEAAQRAGQSVVITLAEYNRLQTGMTYDQCAAIIGAEHPMARGYAGQRNAALQGQMTLSEGYRWQNPGGYYAEVSFRNGRITRKEWKKTSGQAGGGRVSGSSGNVPR
jgi:hypothetical protein